MFAMVYTNVDNIGLNVEKHCNQKSINLYKEGVLDHATVCNKVLKVEPCG